MKRRIVIGGALACAAGTALASEVQNPSFETGTYQAGFDAAVGDWMSDGAAYVAGDSTLSPFEGNRMLQFLTTAPDGGADGASSDISQLLDISDIAAAIDAGEASVDAMIYVNRVDAGPTTDTRMGISIYAFETMPTTIGEYLNPTLRTITKLTTDADTSTWEPIDVSMDIPSGVRYVGITIFALENVVNDNISPEFAGHFADGLSLTIVPAPASAALLGLGGLAIARRRR